MNNELLLITGKNIPFIEAQIDIHQPTMNEISLIGEENFFAGCQFLNLSKDQLVLEDKTGLEDKSDFEIFMSIMCSKEKIEYRNSVLMLLALIFPEYQINFTPNDILLVNEKHSTRINNTNYDVFKNIINTMFGLNESDPAKQEFNPSDDRARKIAEKIKKHKEKIAHLHGDDKKKIAVFSRYISILSVGLELDMRIFGDYTVFQLKDQFSRYQKKQSFDIYIEGKMAGATGMEEVDNWMKDIHP